MQAGLLVLSTALLGCARDVQWPEWAADGAIQPPDVRVAVGELQGEL